MNGFENRTAAGNAENILTAKTTKTITITIRVLDNKKIVLQVPYSIEHIAKIKTIPYYFWHKEEKYWSFPYTRNILSEIENYFKKLNYQVEIKNINTGG